MIDHGTLTYVVMHVMAGKTTIKQNWHDVTDVDSFPRSADVERRRTDLIAKAVTPDDWEVLNSQIWYPILRQTVKTLPRGMTVLTHSLWDVKAMQLERPGPVYRCHPSEVEFRRRIALVERLDPLRARLAQKNRADELADPEYMALPVWPRCPYSERYTNGAGA